MEWDEFLSFGFILDAFCVKCLLNGAERERETGAGGEGFCRTRVVGAIVVGFILLFWVCVDLVLQTAVATEDAPSSKSNLTVSFLLLLQCGSCLIMLVAIM